MRSTVGHEAGQAAEAVPAPVSAVAAPPVPRVPMTTETVLALQRSAGNRATTVAVRTVVGPALLRGGAPRGPVLRRFAVSVTAKTPEGGGALVVQRVQVGHRPPGLFGNAERSHATSWETFVDALRLEIMGKPLDVALGRVAALYQLTLQMPGMGRAGNLPQATRPAGGAGARAKETPQTRYDSALKRAQSAHAAAQPMIATPAMFTAEQKIEALQEFAAAYLQLRNTTPLAAVVLENPEGGAPLEPIRNHESGENPLDAGTLRGLLWRHLDRRVVARLATSHVTARQAPGIDATLAGPALNAEREARVVEVVRTHLTQMRASYPISYADAQLDSDASVTAYLDSIPAEAGVDPERLAFPAARIPHMVDAIVNGVPLPALVPAPGGRAASQVIAGPDKRFAVQLRTRDAEGGRQVSDMDVGGRPPGIFGSEHGSHLTAWVVLIDRVRALVVGRSLAQAIAGLRATGDPLHATATGGAGRVGALVPPEGQSLAEAATAYDTAAKLPADLPEILRAQALAVGVLMMLNAEPLSAVRIGGPANPSREDRHRAAARNANVAGPVLVGDALSELRNHLWGLFDTKALGVALAASQADRDVPGRLAGETSGRLAGEIVARHLRLIRGAYPDALRRAQLDTAGSVMEMLRATNPVEKDVAIQLLVAAVGVAPEAAGDAFDAAYASQAADNRKRGGAMAVAGANKSRRRDDGDDEYMDD